MRTSFIASCLFTIATIFIANLSSTANAALVVEMSGSVEDGSLNGVDLAGADFNFLGLVTNPTDFDVSPDIGTFAVEFAFIEFGDRGFFEFDPQSFHFAWGGLDSDLFGATMTVFDVDSDTYGTRFGLIDNSPAPGDFTNFDSGQLSDFGPYTDFDEGFTNAVDGSVGPFVADNLFGDSLRIAELSNSGSLFVSAVPEPSAGIGLLAIFSAVGFVRRR